jgi:hypothetical protein
MARSFIFFGHLLATPIDLELVENESFDYEPIAVFIQVKYL